MKDNDTIKDRFEETAKDLFDFGKLHADSVKLRFLEKMAMLSNRIFTTFFLLLLSSFASLFIAVALTMLLAKWIGSMLGAVLIMAGIFIVATLFVYVKRKSLFINNMVKIWSSTLFDKHKD